MVQLSVLYIHINIFIYLSIYWRFCFLFTYYYYLFWIAGVWNRPKMRHCRTNNRCCSSHEESRQAIISASPTIFCLRASTSCVLINIQKHPPKSKRRLCSRACCSKQIKPWWSRRRWRWAKWFLSRRRHSRSRFSTTIRMVL